MSTANRVIKNTGYLYAKMGITMFISLYTTRLILNSLGATDFGIFNIVGGAIAMLGFLNAAMASATQRFMSFAEGEGNKDKQKSIFNVSVVLHLLISLLVGVALLVAGYFFFNGILNIPADRIFAAKVVYGSLIVSTMFTVMTVPYDAVLNAHENMLYYSIVGIVESVLKLIVAFIVVYTLSDKLIIYGILMACIPLVTMTIMRVYCHKHYEECSFKPRRYWHKGLMKEMTSFAGWSFVSSSTNMISQYGLGIVLNHFFGTILNAAQGIAGQLSGQLSVFSMTMLKALNPVITKTVGTSNNKSIIERTLTGCKFTYLLTSLFTIPAIIEMPFILSIWLKEVPGYAVIFARLQLIRILIEQLTIVLSTSNMAQGKIKGISICATFLNLLVLPFTYIAFKLEASPIYIYIIPIVIWGGFGTISKIYFSKMLYKMSYNLFLKKVLYPCLFISVLSLFAGYIITIFLPNGILRLFLIAFLCIVTSILLFIYKGTDEKEKDFFCSSIKTLKDKITMIFSRLKLNK